MHRGERSIDGACREVFEEIGLTLDPKDVHLLTRGFIKYLFGGKKFIIFRSVLETKPQITICSELTGYFWANPKEFKNIKVTNEVSKALAKLLRDNLL